MTNVYQICAAPADLARGAAELGRFLGLARAPVQFYLQTYAKNEYLEEAVIRLDCLRQGSVEGFMAFHGRLLSAARDLHTERAHEKVHAWLPSRYLPLAAACTLQPQETKPHPIPR